MRSEPSEDPQYDYKVFIMNGVDFDWDGGDRGDRQRTVNLMFEHSCKSAEIVDEKPTQTGTGLLGKPAITWMMKVKCVKK